MTIRELFISLGFEVDAQSEKKAEAAIQGLKNTAAAALNAVNTEPLREGMEKASKAYESAREAVQNVMDTLQEGAEAQETVEQAAQGAAEAVQDAVNTLREGTEAQEAVKESAQEAAQAIQEGTEAAAAEAENLKGAFDNVNQSVQDTTESIKEQEESVKKLAPPAEKFQRETKKVSSRWKKLAAFLKKPIKAVVKPKVDEKAQEQAISTLKSIRSMAVKTLGVIGIGFSLANMNALAEEFNGVNDMIRNATRGLGEQAEIQQSILKAANEMKSSYGDTAKIVSNLVQESPDLFGSVDEAANFAALTTKLFKSTGKSQEEINGLQEAINKSFAKGIVDSETINQLYEKAPEAINLISDSLGVAKEDLAKMATDGVLKIADLKNAFISQADVINLKFDELDFSISDALLNIRNQWGYWLDQMNSTTGLTKNIGKFMVQGFSKVMGWLTKSIGFMERLSKMTGGYGNLLKLITAIAAGILVALKGDKIIGFLKTAKDALGGITKHLNKANLKIMAIAAVVALLILIIDDFINFMKGNDSVIGKLFEKAGIDADKARAAITKAWGTVVSFLTKAWETLRQAGITIFNALKAFWERWGEQVKNQFKIIFDFLTGGIRGFIRAVQGLIDFIVGVFTGDWERAWQGIKDIFGGILDSLSIYFHLIWDSIYNWFGEKVDAVRQTLEDGFNSAIEFMQSLPGKALQWGRDFMDGLVNGITEKVSAVTDAVSGVADKIKSFLHFSVPDEGPLTDYESWMPDFMTGLAKGIHKGSPVVYKAIKNLTEGIAKAREAFLGFGTDPVFSLANMGASLSDLSVKPSTAAAAQGGGNRTTNIHQTNNIHNEFKGGDRAAQTEGAKAMGQTAKDTTAEMARALATGR
ncbi:MAG: tape measure protein [Oscillospiraceae bacterium]|nr:tape measure protein [Oscillospiraceae bacterium]